MGPARFHCATLLSVPGMGVDTNQNQWKTINMVVIFIIEMNHCIRSCLVLDSSVIWKCQVKKFDILLWREWMSYLYTFIHVNWVYYALHMTSIRVQHIFLTKFLSDFNLNNQNINLMLVWNVPASKCVGCNVVSTIDIGNPGGIREYDPVQLI